MPKVVQSSTDGVIRFGFMSFVTTIARQKKNLIHAAFYHFLSHANWQIIRHQFHSISLVAIFLTPNRCRSISIPSSRLDSCVVSAMRVGKCCLVHLDFLDVSGGVVFLVLLELNRGRSNSFFGRDVILLQGTVQSTTVTRNTQPIITNGELNTHTRSKERM